MGGWVFVEVTMNGRLRAIGVKNTQQACSGCVVDRWYHPILKMNSRNTGNWRLAWARPVRLWLEPGLYQ